MYAHINKMKHLTKSAKWLFALGLLTLLTSCGEERLTPEDLAEAKPLAVSFDTYLSRATHNTRVASPSETSKGDIDLDKLKQLGFGVMAMHTGSYEYYAYDMGLGRYNDKGAFNFMWNERQSWNSGLLRWTYAPVKYWPNDNNPADDKTAQGSMEHSYLTFFAYAPYRQETTPATGFTATGSDHGIVGLTANSTAADQTCLTYRLATTKKLKDCVDLLWAYPQFNRYKTDGAGTTSGTVLMHFIHALSKLKLEVQGIFDHTSPTDNSTEYPSDVDSQTKIFVESVTISDLPTEAVLYLQPDENSTTTPRWDSQASTEDIAITTSDLNEEVRWTWTPSKTTDADAALTEFNALEEGVTNTVKRLLKEEDDAYLLIPRSTAQTMTVTVKYHVVTYDPALTLNSPKYFSHVTNDIESTTTETFTIEANKTYTLRLLLGLTTVKFEITAEDWAVPMVLDAEVTPWGDKTHEANVE